MKKGTVSLCMIVKDEEVNLARCLNSIEKYVDEIVIVDTGSKDRTIEIAGSFGAVVINDPWQNNFSRARNVGLEHANGEWILFLDADEEAMPDNLPLLRKLGAGKEDGYFIQILNIDGEENCIKQPALRLFRNDPRHRFRGAIHEQIIQSILEHNPCACFAYLDIKINHTGYKDSAIEKKDKLKRNISILEAEYNSGNIDGFLLFNLGTEYLRASMPARALDFFQQAGPLTPPELSFTHLLGKKWVQTLILMNDYQSALEVADRYLALYPDYTDLVFLKACIYYNTARFNKALELYQTCLSMGETPSHYVSEAGVGSFKAETAVKHLSPLVERAQLAGDPIPGISLCMIVKNEANNLTRCLESVKKAVAEIIVVDTGSEDRTVELALSHGAEVFHFPWCGDFALARNFSLGMARRQWILVMDADETLRPEEHHLLQETVKNSNLQGYFLKIVNYFGYGDPDDYAADAVCRLFRNRPEYKFTGPLHEEIAQSIINHAGPDSIAPVEIHIDHRGYLQRPEITKKSVRNTTILRSNLEQRPSDWYSLYALGTEFFQQGDFCAALELYREVLNLNENYNMLSDVYFKTAVCHLELKQFDLCMQILDQGRRLFPDFTSLWYLQGMLEVEQNLLPQACNTLRAALNMGDPPWYRYTYPNGIGTFRSAAILAECLVKMELIDQAETLITSYVKERLGIGLLMLPFCRLLKNKYGMDGCLEKIEQLAYPSCFRESLLLADTMYHLERPDLTQTFIQKCIDFLRVMPEEDCFYRLAGIQLRLAARYCSRCMKSAGPSVVLHSVGEKLKLLL